jgi:hypothetical protein
MDTIVNPLKIVGRAVAPENIVDGLGRKFRSVSCNIMCNKVLGFGRPNKSGSDERVMQSG